MSNGRYGPLSLHHSHTATLTHHLAHHHSVRNLLMIPSRRGAQVLKATKLVEVSEIRDKMLHSRLYWAVAGVGGVHN